MAREAGMPAYYDVGRERLCWFSHPVTHWMGDDGFLRKLHAEFRMFNYYGDTTWVKGKVTNKYVKDGEHMVDIELACINQLGENHGPGSATVILPSKVHGPVVLPAKMDPDSNFAFL